MSGLTRGPGSNVIGDHLYPRRSERLWPEINMKNGSRPSRLSFTRTFPEPLHLTFLSRPGGKNRALWASGTWFFFFFPIWRLRNLPIAAPSIVHSSCFSASSYFSPLFHRSRKYTYILPLDARASQRGRWREDCAEISRVGVSNTAILADDVEKWRSFSPVSSFFLLLIIDS